jgi:hypothetical protein
MLAAVKFFSVLFGPKCKIMNVAMIRANQPFTRGSRAKVRRVLALGSLGPTIMYTLWLAVTLGRRELAVFGASGGDLAAKILADGGALGGAARVQCSLPIALESRLV